MFYYRKEFPWQTIFNPGGEQYGNKGGFSRGWTMGHVWDMYSGNNNECEFRCKGHL